LCNATIRGERKITKGQTRDLNTLRAQYLENYLS